MGEHVPTRTDLVQQCGDGSRVAQVALQAFRRRRLVLAHVHRQHVVATVVEVRRDRRSDARSRTDHHDLASVAIHSPKPFRHAALSGYRRMTDSKHDSKQFWSARQ